MSAGTFQDINGLWFVASAIQPGNYTGQDILGNRFSFGPLTYTLPASLVANGVLTVNSAGTATSFTTSPASLTPISQINGQLATSTSATITNAGTPGVVTWTYKLTVYDQFGCETLADAGASTTTGNATLTGSNYNIITAPATLPAGAVGWNVYRTVVGTSPTTTGIIGQITSGGGTLNDTALVGDGSTVPTFNETGVCAPYAAVGPNATAYGAYLITPYPQALGGAGAASSPNGNGPTANTPRVLMFVCDRTITVNRVSMNVIANVAASTCNVGIYRADGGRKLIDVTFSSGSIAIVTTTTAVTPGYGQSGFPFTFYAGRTYYFACSSSSASTVTLEGASQAAGINNLFNTVHARFGYAGNTTSAAVMPATLGTITAQSASAVLALWEP